MPRNHKPPPFTPDANRQALAIAADIERNRRDAARREMERCIRVVEQELGTRGAAEIVTAIRSGKDPSQ